ncbi:MAG: hypothetical protein HOZ81_49715 [Streptomyces sp.]|nr:hypothetical protein [Streptomyces sp.]
MYQPQPYSQPYYAPVPMPGPYVGPVQYTTVTETGFNPITAMLHVFLWLFFHWWVALLTVGLWLIPAVLVTFIGWKVTRKIPVQPMHYYQPPYPPQLPPRY